MLTIYTRTTCAYCAMVKRLFDKKEVEYETVNLDEHPEREEEAYKLSGVVSVPVITNGKDTVVGFQPTQLLGLV